ncbi:MAG TPA: glucose-6-phosphate isomerase [Beijerinckiaceae bacterium]
MTEDALWQELGRLAESARGRSLRALFAEDPDRFARFSRRFGTMLFDFSKTSLTDDDLRCLLDLARAAGVEEKRDAMLSGAPYNLTEGRAALHAALRADPKRAIAVEGRNVVPEVEAVLARMAAFVQGVRSGAVAGADGEPFTAVLNIGIGGSDLGPAMATLALAPFHDGPRVVYVSNVDGAHLADTLKSLDPARTLVIVASKTFTTVETMTNAASARRWIVEALGEEAVSKHFAAVSTALDKVAAFGINETNVFGFWDWVGGRYSVWSAVGLPLMIAVGEDNFRAFLAGARAMDEHFASAPLADNLPVLLALVGVWHRSGLGLPSRAVIPYDQRLARLPAYLQQLDMESNGKGVRRDGTPVSRPTGPVVWGEPGTNGQHAFFQLLHQGTDVVPVEFLVAAEGHEPDLAHHHALLLANCLAQGEALMRGRTLDEARAQLAGRGLPEAEVERLAPHRVFPGDRPSTTLLYPRLDPATLGSILALCEHRVFVEAAIWDINPFDQWGVELGKELATALQPLVEGKAPLEGRDGSTLGLLRAVRDLRKA